MAGCPICGEAASAPEPGAPDLRPFCSKRCADIDLGRWMLGAYALPAEEEDTPEDADVAPTDPATR